MFDRVKKGMYWDRAWSLIEGCRPVSAGCQHCWAAQQTYMRSHQRNPKIKGRYEGLNKDKTTFNGKIRLMDENLDIPLRICKPTVWAIWNDFFHPSVPLDFQAEALHVMVACPQHIFIILTKRHKQLAIFNEVCGWSAEVYPNVWPGVSVEDQPTADLRIGELLKVTAEIIFVSFEPALGSLILPSEFLERGKRAWCIVGGETGPGARPMNPEWARQVRDQCVAAGVPFFLKSLGEWSNQKPSVYLPDGWGVLTDDGIWFPQTTLWNGRNNDGEIAMFRVGKKQAGRLLDGREYSEIPERRCPAYGLTEAQQL